MAAWTRRTFLKQTAAAAALAGLGRRGAAAERRPNILFFITDDQSWCDTSAYG